MQVGLWAFSSVGLSAHCSSEFGPDCHAENVTLLLSEEVIDECTATVIQQNGAGLVDLLLAACVLLADLLPYSSNLDRGFGAGVLLQYAALVDDFAPTSDPQNPWYLTGMDRVMQCLMMHVPHSLTWLQVCIPTT